MAPDGHAPPPALRFTVLAHTGIRLADVTPTARGLLYQENTANTLWSAPPSGLPLTRFASLPKNVEETRCRVSPGVHGWPAGDIFCHTPDASIYRISADGRSVIVFARLSRTARSDGALAFDPVGRFGYGLVAATGRSGSAKAKGGTVYSVTATGTVHRVARYAGPGAADGVAIAPSGAARGAALLTVDAGAAGRVIAVQPNGTVTTIARLPDGPNPIAALVQTPSGGIVPPGLYLTDTLSTNVYFAPASAVRRLVGQVIVGSELKGRFWRLVPQERAYRLVPLSSSLRGAHYNLEGMAYVSG